MLLNNLPEYSGPFKVGCRDIEYLKSDQSLYDEFKLKTKSNNNSPLLIRLYFPIREDSKLDQLAEWGTYPKQRYIRGLLDYAKIPTYISNPLINFFGGSPKIASYINDGSDIITSPNRLPIAIFSHGLAGSRTFYSGICGELASYGMIVAAIEHRDQSAVFSYTVTEPSEMEYLRPPEDEKEHIKFRQNQLKFRIKEVKRTWNLLKELDQGNIEEKWLASPHSLDKEQYTIYTEGKWFNGLKSFKERLNFNESFMVGHSFGGATALEVTSEESTPFKACVTLDPWMFGVTCKQVYKPTIAITTQAFADWNINFEASKVLLRNSMNSMNSMNSKLEEDNSFKNIVMIQPNSKHIDQSDIPIVVSKYLKYIMTFKISPIKALKDNALACVSFIQRHLSNNLKEELKMNSNEDILTTDSFIFSEI